MESILILELGASQVSCVFNDGEDGRCEGPLAGLVSTACES